MSKEDAWKLFDPYDNAVVIGDSMTVYKMNMLKVAFFAGYEAAEHGVQADGAYCVCPQSLIPAVGVAPTECPYCHQPRR